MSKKKWSIMILCMICTFTISYAQKGHKRGGTVEDKVNRRITRIDEVCKLNETQKADLKVLFTDMHKKKKEAYCMYEEGSTELKNAYQTIGKDSKEGLKKILTPDQQKLLKAHRKEMKDQRKNKTGEPPVDK